MLSHIFAFQFLFFVQFVPCCCAYCWFAKVTPTSSSRQQKRHFFQFLGLCAFFLHVYCFARATRPAAIVAQFQSYTDENNINSRIEFSRCKNTWKMYLINNKVGFAFESIFMRTRRFLLTSFSCRRKYIKLKMKFEYMSGGDALRQYVWIARPRMCNHITLALIYSHRCTPVRFNQFSSHRILIAIIVNCV